MTPNRDWLDFMKLAFGFVLLLILGGLAGAIGLGHVEEKSSYGLNIILGGLLTLSGAFTAWCFERKD